MLQKMLHIVVATTAVVSFGADMISTPEDSPLGTTPITIDDLVQQGFKFQGVNVSPGKDSYSMNVDIFFVKPAPVGPAIVTILSEESKKNIE